MRLVPWMVGPRAVVGAPTAVGGAHQPLIGYAMLVRGLNGNGEIDWP